MIEVIDADRTDEMIEKVKYESSLKHAQCDRVRISIIQQAGEGREVHAIRNEVQALHSGNRPPLIGQESRIDPRRDRRNACGWPSMVISVSRKSVLPQPNRLPKAQRLWTVLRDLSVRAYSNATNFDTAFCECCYSFIGCAGIGDQHVNIRNRAHQSRRHSAQFTRVCHNN
jgi:hypothetical protein